MRPLVKICGLTRARDVEMCIRHGADIVGFVVEYPRSVPWNLDAQQAGRLIPEAAGQAKTCIVTGGSPEHILRLAQETKPDYVQLHYRETPEETAIIAGELAKRGIRVIKALSPDSAELEAAADFETAGAWALLLDPRAPDHAAQGGSVNFTAWQTLKKSTRCPLILAGGLTPKNVTETIRRTGAEIIDLMTGVESSPGIKDEQKVKALFQALDSSGK